MARLSPNESVYGVCEEPGCDARFVRQPMGPRRRRCQQCVKRAQNERAKARRMARDGGARLAEIRRLRNQLDRDHDRIEKAQATLDAMRSERAYKQSRLEELEAMDGPQ